MGNEIRRMKLSARAIKASAWVWLTAVVLSSAAMSANAQTQQPDPSSRSLTQSKSTSSYQPIRLGGVTLSGNLRVRIESWDWFDTPAADGNYTFGAAQLRLSLSKQNDEFDWQVEGEFPWLIGLPRHAIAPAPQGQLGFGGSYLAANGAQDASATLKQAFVRFKGLGGDKAGSLRVGRFEFVDGAEIAPKLITGDTAARDTAARDTAAMNDTLATLKRDSIAHRLIGPFGFTHIGRSFDGVQYVRNTKDFNLTVMGARVTEGAFQLNANKEMNVDVYLFMRAVELERSN
ncbi:MAG: hypothetical protein DMF61_18625 [Blastocatellia bacterium AA13]|nr:MAG: hypothetical protein DMF61_18625 [Blastocatellia bacterium AA13]